MSYTGALREVREELAPEIPNLAQELPMNEFAICDALYAALVHNGMEPRDLRAIPEIDWIKTEQHTMVAWGSGVMRHGMVEGEDQDTHFRPGILPIAEVEAHAPPGTSPTRRLVTALDCAVDNSARGLLKRYKTGDNPRGLRIVPALSERYVEIGYRRQDIVRAHEGALVLGEESLSLLPALSSVTFAPEIGKHLNFINEKVKGDEAAKLAAAHDTSSLPYGLSAHNVHKSGAARDALQSVLRTAQIIQDPETGRYIVKTEDGHAFHAPRVQQGARDTTLKCPARIDGNLMALITASINAAGLFGVFKPSQQA